MNLKYTRSKKHCEGARNQALGAASLPAPAHLKEALTTRPLMGCGGRQFPTRGTGGSFSALDRRLRSLAICEGQGRWSAPHRAPWTWTKASASKPLAFQRDKQTATPAPVFSPELSGGRAANTDRSFCVKTLDFIQDHNACWSEPFPPES